MNVFCYTMPNTMLLIGGIIITISFSAVQAHFVRIVNGTYAEEGEFPYAVSLRINKHHTCGGTILNKDHILTAAHCTCKGTTPNDPSEYSIQYGSINISEDDERSVNVSKIICHDYLPSELKYDAAILKLHSPIPDDYYVPVTLAKEYDTSRNSTGSIIGWGFTSTTGPVSKVLQKAEVNIYNDDICSQLEGGDPTHHICFGADNAGACFGDSGTALIVDGIQVGIASFITNEECGIANPSTPNVYARVASYHDWIMQQLTE